jgi:hypothetical protein
MLNMRQEHIQGALLEGACRFHKRKEGSPKGRGPIPSYMSLDGWWVGRSAFWAERNILVKGEWQILVGKG